MAKFYYCNGCCERKPESEMKDYRGELLCKFCRNSELISDEYSELENKELELTDKIIDAESVVRLWEDNLEIAKSKVKQAKELYNENEKAKTDFNWNRWILNEPREDSN